jgi:hypothetical protein
MQETRKILSESRDAKRNGIALQAVRELRGNLELLGKIEAAIHSRKLEAVDPELRRIREAEEELARTFNENFEKVLLPEEQQVWDGIVGKVLSELPYLRIPRIKYVDGQDAEIHDFSGVVGRPNLGKKGEAQDEPPSGENVQNSASIEATEIETEPVQEVEHDMKVRPIPPEQIPCKKKLSKQDQNILRGVRFRPK